MKIKKKLDTFSEMPIKFDSKSNSEQIKKNKYFVFPLSFQQESLWFLDQLEPGKATYNVPICLNTEGELNLSALEKSLAIMINHHEVLRTSFKTINNEASQIISTGVYFKPDYFDLSSFPQTERFKKGMALANHEAKYPFDLEKSPLFRCTIIKLTDSIHLITFIFHHIIFDGGSAGIFIKELGTIYNNILTGNDFSYNDSSLQFADFTVWQREWFKSEDKQKQLDFWKHELKNSNTYVELPSDFTRPSKLSYTGDFIRVKIPDDFISSLKSLSRLIGCTLFMTLLSSFEILIYLYSGQKDISIGAPIVLRNNEELENLIGYYTNTVVFRSIIDPSLSFTDYLVKMYKKSVKIFENKDMPFDKLVEEIQPQREPNRNPIFQILFGYQKEPEFESIFKDLKIKTFQLGTGTSKFDLFFEFREGKNGIEALIEYSTDLFKADTIRKIADHFEILLREITSDPNKKISEYSLLGDDEIKFLDNINNTKVIYSGPESIHNLFENQVDRTPDKTAVEFEGKGLTYSELNARANQVAKYLQKLGIQPGKLVGICVDRSLEMLIGMIGILKTGCAYVPLDPSFPADRLNFMLEDAGINILLTQKKFKEIFLRKELKILLLDKEWELIKKEEDKNFHSHLSSEELAYVIYTSGSTGKPKGVEVKHKAVVNFLLSMQNKPGLSSDDILLSVTTISFDISVLELFLPIISGAKVIIASKETSIDGILLLKLLNSTNTSVMQATPATWRLLIEAGWESSPNLKMLCGGEAFSLELANQMLARGASLWNMYGPTETTVWSSVKKINPDSNAILIGLPIENTQFYIVDKNMKRLPVNVPGELLIGGEALARGYLNNPELTNEKFITNPFSKSASRLYRTGDLARFKPGGDIEFLGRLDFQIKIRGFRIELGEIEKVLESINTIKSALVTGRDFGGGDIRLIAYIIPALQKTPNLNQIKNFLRQKLPEYMIPSFFIVMEKFPLTPNEKVDRNALPEPERDNTEISESFVEPRDEIEENLTRIWEEILNFKPIGTNDNYFDIGGNSLLLMNLKARILELWGVSIPIITLFTETTVKKQSLLIKLLMQKSDVEVTGNSDDREVFEL